MIIDCTKIAEAFFTFNYLYFDNILPEPYFKIRHGFNILGYFRYELGAPFGETETIEITDFYDYTINQFRDILVHEMIHYYLYYIGEDTKLRHGKAFKKMARQLNDEFHLDIRVHPDTSKMKPRRNAPFFTRLLYDLFN